MKLYSSRYTTVFVLTLFVLIVPNLFLMTKSNGAQQFGVSNKPDFLTDFHPGIHWKIAAI